MVESSPGAGTVKSGLALDCLVGGDSTLGSGDARSPSLVGDLGESVVGVGPLTTDAKESLLAWMGDEVGLGGFPQTLLSRGGEATWERLLDGTADCPWRRASVLTGEGGETLTGRDGAAVAPSKGFGFFIAFAAEMAAA